MTSVGTFIKGPVDGEMWTFPTDPPPPNVQIYTTPDPGRRTGQGVVDVKILTYERVYNKTTQPLWLYLLKEK